MTNPYREYLNLFFELITDFKHSSNRLNKLLQKDVEVYTAKGATYFSGTSLAIGDWTGPTDNGWKLIFPTGIKKFTRKENYAKEIENVISREFGLVFSQCYEALETLLKDLVNEKILLDDSFKDSIAFKKAYSRDLLKGGEELFKLIKKAGGNRFKEYSKKNNPNFKFKELFTVFSEVRHAVTHSRGSLKTNKIPSNPYYKSLFEHLFPNSKLEGKEITMDFDYATLDRNLIYFAEFGFQIFKILSEEDSYEWKI